jgi:hypothetical protein
MTEPEQKLTPATPDDLAASLSCALRFKGHKSQHDSDRLNADTVARAGVGRVGVWRGGYRSSISVCRPFRLAVP